MPRDPVQAGAAPYSRVVLSIYDLWVLKISSRFAWRCPSDRILAVYDENVSANHLEVGPGSGYFLAHTTFPVDRPSVTLLDLNPNPLAFTADRLPHAEIATIVGSVLEPVAARTRFASIGINYVLHCVPGTWAEKGIAFRHLAEVLDDGGVLFGSTVLGTGRPKNAFGSLLMTVYNRIGAFANRADDKAGLEQALASAFADVTLMDVGDVVIFTARTPIR